MPVMDGYEATRVIRDPTSAVRDHAVPVVAMTANVLSGDREQCLAAGMDDYLSKPLDPAALSRILERWLAPAAVDQEDTSAALTREVGDPAEIFNRAELLDRVMGDAALADEVVDAFLVEIERLVTELATAAAAGDSGRRARIAHTIKGAAGNVGATSIQRCAKQLEHLAAGGAGDFERKARELTAEVARFRQLVAGSADD